MSFEAELQAFCRNCSFGTRSNGILGGLDLGFEFPKNYCRYGSHRARTYVCAALAAYQSPKALCAGVCARPYIQKI